MDNLDTQTVIDIFTLANAHAGLSAEASMGRLIQFDTAAAEATKDQTNALKTRRISNSMTQHLNTVADLAISIGALELEMICEHALKVRGETKDVGALMAQGVLFLDSLSRTRLAARVIIEMCETLGIAPNGKKLPKEI
jgi:hypothetical protein